jgi:hypothetical protein
MAMSIAFVLSTTGMQPVLVHLSKNKQGTYSFDPVSVNFMTEMAKTTFALITLFIFVSVTSGGSASSHTRHPQSFHD